MTPAARYAAAAAILDDILAGGVTEAALTGWARRSRFAGSSDRAAVRDITFDIIRRRLSCAWVGGGQTGRSLILGHVLQEGMNPAEVFTGENYALANVTSDEIAESRTPEDIPKEVLLDAPTWLIPKLEQSLGEKLDNVMECLRHRAPVTIRVNHQSATHSEVSEEANDVGISLEKNPLAISAYNASGNVRRLSGLPIFERGGFEFQDASSQAVVERLSPLVKGAAVLDYCAGGGGKTLAMAANSPRSLIAHDASFDRMKDLKRRAQRANIAVDVSRSPEGLFDLVLCDVPCSGSGAWRRQPDAKWRLTEARLEELKREQQSIMQTACNHVRAGGHLAYVTCSILDDENRTQISTFLHGNAEWSEIDSFTELPSQNGDGFFLSVLHLSSD